MAVASSLAEIRNHFLGRHPPPKVGHPGGVTGPHLGDGVLSVYLELDVCGRGHVGDHPPNSA